MTAQPAHIARAPDSRNEVHGKRGQIIPDEHAEQSWLMQWCHAQSAAMPSLKLLYAIPNGNLRHPRVAAKLKAEGVSPGVPDLCLPVARGAYHGLYIEMKRRKGGVVSPHQRAWMDFLRREGYRAEVCAGWEVARDVLVEYLRS